MLIDTSGLLCLFDSSDYRHVDAQTFYYAAPLRVTHNYILAEFIVLAYSRGMSREETLERVIAVLAEPEVEVVWVDEGLHREGVILLQKRLDKGWSLCDAISILLMQQRGVAEALTTDHDFEQAGLQRLLPQ